MLLTRSLSLKINNCAFYYFYLMVVSFEFILLLSYSILEVHSVAFIFLGKISLTVLRKDDIYL